MVTKNITKQQGSNDADKKVHNQRRNFKLIGPKRNKTTLSFMKPNSEVQTIYIYIYWRPKN